MNFFRPWEFFKLLLFGLCLKEKNPIDAAWQLNKKSIF